MKQYETDVVVVGCGVAGLSASLSALESGSRCITLERSSYEERGGNSRWTDANLLIETDTKSFQPTDYFWHTLTENGKFHLFPDMEAETANEYESWHPNLKTAPMFDPALLYAFGENIPTTLNWLEEHGVKIDTAQHSFPFFIRLPGLAQIYGGGLTVIETLTPIIEDKGGEILCETTATELMFDDMGKICGLHAIAANNEPVQIKAKAVVLASGGFQGNPQMLAQYCGENARYLRPVAKGGYYNKGEGLRMALAANAAPAGDWSDVHRQMVDPRSPHPEALTHIWQCGIVVNQEGKRFFDEFESVIERWFEEPGKRILEQPGGISYIIYDEQLNGGDYQDWRLGLRTEIPPIVGNTLAELAEKLEIPADQLEQTVAEYNSACVNSDNVQFGHINPETMGFDGLGTEGVTPKKSNGAKRIEKGPFYCYPMIASICFTLGGLRITPSAQVINYSADVIPGLYAAGETVGMNYGMYSSATSVLRGLVFGKIAGEHAASL